ncbi:MAG: AMP-binding protein, partial [Chitinophagaceae bacterium]|nr:AMP-binding protein [Chitinophagaceae bacterium]
MKIYFRDQTFLFSDIIQNKIILPPSETYKENVFSFIKKWNNEEKTFNITTSGSTSTPKKITLLREQMEASASSTIHFLNLPQKTPVTICINIHFIGGIMQIVRGIINKSDIYIVEPSAHFFENIPTDWNIGLISLFPLQLEKILEKNAIGILQKATAILIGGAPLHNHLIEKCNNITTPLYHTFGMTETVSHIALKRLNGEQKSHYFQCLPDIEIRKDARGCLEVKGNITRNIYVPTNDLVEIVDGTSFFWKGRFDNIINSGGIKISLDELENTIKNIFEENNIKELFFLASVPDKSLGQKIILTIEKKNYSIILSKKKIKILLKEKLPQYLCPRN